ncbi:MAG TPA: undecaprenyldiphospho-muramoylpentapeptide beta-N-acetylglucosaminyltransferase [Patescibacteria group bacterium]|nr:undecaprenyldiphospho-muramoylpentapeptide beta-N-acetylglucosaminyltransferase [Patescibacteria group bacterium]
MRIVLTGGGSGGHTFPLIAVAQALRAKDPSVELFYIGVRGQLFAQTQKAFETEKIPARYIFAGKLRRYASFSHITDLFFKMPISMIQSLWHVLWLMPDAVFSKGGYGSVPVVIAARLYRIPVLTHESDARPGWANRIIGKISTRVAVSYPTARDYFLAENVVMTGNPIRDDIMGGSADAARTHFHFTTSKPVILVMGGSQGSQLINDAILSIFPDLLTHAQVIHSTGAQHHETVIHQAAEQGIKEGREGYVAVPFLERDALRDAYALADLVITRAGANTITEIAANKKPAIIIPLTNAANDHQRMNAYALAQIGGALVLEEANLGKNILLEKVTTLLTNQDLRTRMVESMGTFYHADAAEKIARGLEEIVQGA